jgi:cation diffusion facilitator family transporter
MNALPRLGFPERVDRTNSARIAARAAYASIWIAGLLAAVKIIFGWKGHSVAVISDGIENAADLVTSGLVWLGLLIAAKPADQDHPYGHGRFETLSGLAVGMFLVAVGAGISIRSFVGAGESEVIHLFAIWPVIASIAIKVALATWKWRLGKRTGSTALRADAKHDLVDILSGGVALIAVLLAVFGAGMHWADHYGGIVIGIVVIFMGLRVIRETVLQLVDTMPDDFQMKQIRAAALRVPGALAVEKCFARKTGLRYHVDLHLEVDPHLSVLESHDIAHRVRLAVVEDLDWVEDVLIHVEPHLAGAAQIT